MQFSQSLRYSGYTNPALSGLNNEIDAVVAHRSQYVNLSNQIIASQHVGVHLPLLSNKLGVGFSLVNDYIGYQRYTAPTVNAAYHVPVGSNYLSLGAGLGFVQMGLNGSLLRGVDGVYTNGQVIHNDGLIPNDKVGGMNFTSSFGINFKGADYSVGVAMHNINAPRIRFDEQTNGTFTNISRTINLHGSYVISIGSVKMQPSFFYKTDITKHQLQTNLMFASNNILFGASFRGYSGFNNDAIIGHFGFKVKSNFSIQYSYDYVVSGLSQSSSGSHEISLRFQKKRKFDEKTTLNILYTPRFL